MLELASAYGTGEPMRIRDISEQQDIPPRFLVQILLQLKSAGLVLSTRGAAGGYQLQRSPQEITLAEVMAVIDGPEPLPDPASAASPAGRVLLRTWHDILAAEQEMLRAVTLADLVEQVHGEAESMYYI